MGKEPGESHPIGTISDRRRDRITRIDGDRTISTEGGPAVDIVVTGRRIDVPALLRAHAEEKLAKVREAGAQSPASRRRGLP